MRPKILLAVLLAAFLVLLVWGGLLSASAQDKPAAPRNCFPVEVVLEVVNNQKMHILWKGLGNRGEQYAIYVRADGYWTVIVMAPDMSMACLPAEGPQNRLEGKGA